MKSRILEGNGEAVHFLTFIQRLHIRSARMLMTMHSNARTKIKDGPLHGEHASNFVQKQVDLGSTSIIGGLHL